MNILDELVAKGVSGEVIIAVAQLIADAMAIERQRASARERMRLVRERARTHANGSEQVAAICKEEKVYPKEESKKVRKENKHSLPEDWQPKGEQRDPTEVEEFRDNAHAKAWKYANWDAAYRNFQRSPYNARNKNGGMPLTNIDERRREIGERMHAQGASPHDIQRAWKAAGLAKAGEGVDRGAQPPDLRPEGALVWNGGKAVAQQLAFPQPRRR